MPALPQRREFQRVPARLQVAVVASGGGLEEAVLARRSCVGEEPIIRAGAKGKKFPSRSYGPVSTFRPVFNMIKAFLSVLCLATLCSSTGCLFFRKGKKPKESSTISADVEESFRVRWVDKRAAELTAQGAAADAARAQADNEFRERYGFTRAGKK